MIDEYILDEHLLTSMVELMVEELKLLEWKIMAVDVNDFDDEVLIIKKDKMNFLLLRLKVFIYTIAKKLKKCIIKYSSNVFDFLLLK